MKKTLRRGTVLIGMTALLLAISSPVTADTLKLRHTLFTPVGQRMIRLEAPLGMCFSDDAQNEESALFQDAQGFLDKVDAGQLLGVFTPCADAISQDTGGESPSIFGMVTWLNPEIGETTPLDRAHYLDTQETAFRAALDNGLGAFTDEETEAASEDETANAETFPMPPPGSYTIDKKAARTQNGVTVGYTAETGRDFTKYVVTGVAGTTLAGPVPIAIFLNYTQKTPYDTSKAKTLMDAMLSQQATLNGE